MHSVRDIDKDIGINIGIDIEIYIDTDIYLDLDIDINFEAYGSCRRPQKGRGSGVGSEGCGMRQGEIRLD